MSLIEFFLLVCFIQSIFLAILLLKSSKKERLTNALLSGWVFTWGAMCYFRYYIYQDMQYALKYHFVLKINNLVYLMFFVFPFLYVRYKSQHFSSFKKIDLLHFLPATLALLALFPFFILSAEEKVNILLSYNPYYKILTVTFDYIVIAQELFYIYYSLKYIRDYHNHIKEGYSNIEHLTVYWLRNIIIINFSIWFLGTLGTYIFKSNQIQMYYFDFLFVIIGLSIFYIAFNMYSKKELFPSSYMIEKQRGNSLVDLPENNTVTYIKDKKNSYLDDVNCDEIIANLTQIMETNKLYLDQNLNLEDVSHALSISRHHLSAILNNRLNTSFFDYVNKYRVEEVKKKILHNHDEKLTLLAIAYDAGFNSKATFNRSFKKHEGMTPLEYRNNFKS